MITLSRFIPRDILSRIALSCMLIAGLSLSSFSAHAQSLGVSMLNFTAKPDKKIEELVTKGLRKKLDAFYEEFNYMPYLQYATTDLNGDGKPEIIARFVEEYAYRDKDNNVDTHVFAYTTRGLIEVLEVQAFDMATGRKDGSGLKELIVFKGAGRDTFDVYGWDKRKYVKK